VSASRSGLGLHALQLLPQRVQEAAHALVAPGGRLVAIEEAALFREDEAGAGALLKSAVARETEIRAPSMSMS
jgi:hypothetical protein